VDRSSVPLKPCLSWVSSKGRALPRSDGFRTARKGRATLTCALTAPGNPHPGASAPAKAANRLIWLMMLAALLRWILQRLVGLSDGLARPEVRTDNRPSTIPQRLWDRGMRYRHAGGEPSPGARANHGPHIRKGHLWDHHLASIQSEDDSQTDDHIMLIRFGEQA
jgi:hypothetical protein